VVPPQSVLRWTTKIRTRHQAVILNSETAALQRLFSLISPIYYDRYKPNFEGYPIFSVSLNPLKSFLKETVLAIFNFEIFTTLLLHIISLFPVSQGSAEALVRRASVVIVLTDDVHTARVTALVRAASLRTRCERSLRTTV